MRSRGQWLSEVSRITRIIMGIRIDIIEIKLIFFKVDFFINHSFLKKWVKEMHQKIMPINIKKILLKSWKWVPTLAYFWSKNWLDSGMKNWFETHTSKSESWIIINSITARSEWMENVTISFLWVGLIVNEVDRSILTGYHHEH